MYQKKSFPFINFSSLDECATIPNTQSHCRFLSVFIFHRTRGDSNSKANQINCLEHKMRSRSIIEKIYRVLSCILVSVKYTYSTTRIDPMIITIDRLQMNFLRAIKCRRKPTTDI